MQNTWFFCAKKHEKNPTFSSSFLFWKHFEKKSEKNAKKIVWISAKDVDFKGEICYNKCKWKEML